VPNREDAAVVEMELDDDVVLKAVIGISRLGGAQTELAYSRIVAVRPGIVIVDMSTNISPRLPKARASESARLTANNP